MAYLCARGHDRLKLRWRTPELSCLHAGVSVPVRVRFGSILLNMGARKCGWCAREVVRSSSRARVCVRCCTRIRGELLHVFALVAVDVRARTVACRGRARTRLSEQVRRRSSKCARGRVRTGGQHAYIGLGKARSTY
eukprot:6200284-Pleurochrysis_carterae.AAC.1